MWFDACASPGELESPAVQPYVYPPVPGDQNQQQGEGIASESPVVRASSEVEKGREGMTPAEIFSVDEVRVREEQARATGAKEGEAKARAKFEQDLLVARDAITGAVRDFECAKDAYFHRVEAVVVKLAVEIARKILHREVQVDPLLLAGVVRVALDKVSGGTTVRLRVHPDHVYAWHDFFANLQSPRLVPELLGDATLGTGHCVLETALGTTDLSMEAQLVEIERGFFDLLAQRPVAS